MLVTVTPHFADQESQTHQQRFEDVLMISIYCCLPSEHGPRTTFIRINQFGHLHKVEMTYVLTSSSPPDTVHIRVYDTPGMVENMSVNLDPELSLFGVDLHLETSDWVANFTINPDGSVYPINFQPRTNGGS